MFSVCTLCVCLWRWITPSFGSGIDVRWCFFENLEQKRVQVFLRLSEYYSFILLEMERIYE